MKRMKIVIMDSMNMLQSNWKNYFSKLLLQAVVQQELWREV